MWPRHQLYADDMHAYNVHCSAADAVSSVGLMHSAIDTLSRNMDGLKSSTLEIHPKHSLFGMVDLDSTVG